MIWLIALNVAAQIADYLSTRRVLERGGVELNPASRLIIERFGMMPWLVLKAAVAAWAVLAWYPDVVPGLLTAALFFGVAAYNWRLVG